MIQIRNKKPYLIIIIGFFLIFIIIIGITAIFLHHQTQQKKVSFTLGDGTVYYDDGTMSLAEGGVAYGLYDLQNKFYDHDRPGDIVNGEFSAIASFQQNLPGISEYILIIMVDFKQVEFETEGTFYRNYRFSLEGADEYNLKFKLSNLPVDAHEMEFVVFYDPDCMELSLDDEGWENVSDTGHAYATRLLFSSSKGHPDNLKYIEGMQMDDQDDGVYLSKYKNDITIFPEAKSGEKAYLYVGNYYEEEADYVPVAFCNWEQVDILSEVEDVYLKIPSHKINYYEIDLPEVQKDCPYQIIVFNKPFGDVEYFYEYMSTTRTIIRGK